MKVKLLKRAKRVRKFADATSFSEKLYVSGLLLLLWSCVLWLFSDEYSTIAMLSGFVIFTSGLVSEAFFLIRKMWENKYAKVILSILAAIGSTVTIAASTFVVADIVGTDPSKFPYTTAIVSFLLIPINSWLALLAISITTMIIYVAAVPLLWVYAQTLSSPVFRYIFRLKLKPRKERYFWLMVVVRVIAVSFLFGTIQFWGRFDTIYSSFLIEKASAFVYNFELYPNSHCSKHNISERFGYINAKLAVVGTIDSQGKYNFETRQCIDEK